MPAWGDAGCRRAAAPLARADRRRRHRLRRPARADRPDHAPAGNRARGRGDVALPLRRGRDDLLEGMVDQMVAQLHLRPDGGRPGPADGWQAYLQWLAHGVRPLARDHPQVFPLIATRHPAAPWLRPPLRSLRVVEDFLSTLVARGFTDDARGGGLPRVLQLPARTPAARGQPARQPDGPGGRPRGRRASGRPEPTRVDLRDFPLLRGWRTACPRTTRPRSSNGRWRTCWTGSSATCPTTLGTTGPAQSAMCRR